MAGTIGMPLSLRRCRCGAWFEGRGRAKWCSERCRKRFLYGGTCEGCGGPTTGSNGLNKAPRLCFDCTQELQAELRRALRTEKDEQVLALRWEGVSNEDIERRLGLSYNSVATRLSRMRREGVSVPPSAYWYRGSSRLPTRSEPRPAYQPSARDELLLKLRRAGLNNQQIDAQLGLRPNCAAQRFSYMRQRGVDVPPNPYRAKRGGSTARSEMPFELQLRMAKPPREPGAPGRRYSGRPACRRCREHMRVATAQMLCGFCLAEQEQAAA